MKIKKAYFLVAIVTMFSIVFSGIAAAHNIIVDPESITLDLVAGDIVTENITIRWRGENRGYFELSTNIIPDGIGINVTYSENTFFLDPNTEILIEMVINTSRALIPGTYIITTNVGAEMEEPDEDIGEEDESHWYPDDYLPDYKPPEPPDDEEPVDEDDEFVSVLYYTVITEDGRFSFWIFGIIGVAIGFASITLLYIISKRRKKAEKPGKKENENKNK